MRMGAAWRYLTAEVRRRPNLTVLGDTQVDRLLFDGNRCTGVRVRGPAGEREIRAREVIVSSGAIQSPVLLMRSGIGPEHELRAHGIEVVADRRGVGKHLMEHPGVNFGCFLKRPARLPTELAAADVRRAALVVRPRRLPARRHVRDPDQQGAMACHRPSPRHHHDVGQPLVSRRARSG